MCLAVPGRLVEVTERDALASGRVDFGGVTREVCLAFVPRARVGDFVLVHAGFALGVLDEAQAMQTLDALRSVGEAP